MSKSRVDPKTEVPVVALDDVSKTLGNTRALDGVTFEIARPGVTGIIGPNGAGKTTLLRILSCQTTPDSGSARVFDRCVASEPYLVRRLLTLLPQGIKGHFYTFTPREYIYHYHRIRGKSRRESRRITERAIDEFGIDFEEKKIDELSGGMVRRMMLSMTLSFDTPLYLLDEPTAGLDPAAKQALWDRIRKRAADSHVLLTSHHTDEITDVCDQVLLLDDGEIVIHGETDSVACEYLTGFRRKIVVETAVNPPSMETETVDRGRYRHVYPRNETEFEEIRTRLTEEGCQHIVAEVSVEDLFLTGWNDGLR